MDMFNGMTCWLNSVPCCQQALKSEYKVFYLDDGTLGGRVNSVLEDLQLVECLAPELGLQLNHKKTEVIGQAQAVEEVLFSAPDLQVVPMEEAELLGSPIGEVKSIDKALAQKLEALKTMGNRLQHLHRHDALLLLHHSFALPKVLYILRTAPCFESEFLEAFDEQLRNILSGILNVNLSDTDSIWL